MARGHAEVDLIHGISGSFILAGRRRRPGGFTIVELLIVVVIAGIIAAMALPMMAGTDSTRLAAAARLLIADLGFAQIESIAHGDDPCVVVFDTATNSYRITSSSDTATAITNPADNRPYVTQFGQGRAAEMNGVTIEAYSLGGDDQLGFGIYGQPDQTSPATITLAAGTSTLTITVDPGDGEATVN